MAPKKMKKAYVSEFTRFMQDYLAAHPEVTEDQHRGWYIYWDHHVEPSEIDRPLKEDLPATPYL